MKIIELIFYKLCTATIEKEAQTITKTKRELLIVYAVEFSDKLLP